MTTTEKWVVAGAAVLGLAGLGYVVYSTTKPSPLLLGAGLQPALQPLVTPTASAGATSPSFNPALLSTPVSVNTGKPVATAPSEPLRLPTAEELAAKRPTDVGDDWKPASLQQLTGIFSGALGSKLSGSVSNVIKNLR